MAYARFRLFDEETALAWARRAGEVGWVDGRISATGKAKDIKNNRQMNHDNGGLNVLSEIEAFLLNSALVYVQAFPKYVVGLMINAYGPGETYGWHVDNSTMNTIGRRCRTDYSFTIGLSRPSDYEGGELQFYQGETLQSIRPDLGEMILYPTGMLHQVTPVTTGERTSCVGWFQSWIQDSDVRQALTKLRALNLECERLEGFPKALVLRQTEAFHMLFRRFAS